MKKLIKSKGTVSLCITITILLIQSSVFLITWVLFYNKQLFYYPFYNKGFILLTFVYTVLLIAFSSLYGGYKIGYFRVSDVIYSQVIALIFVNAITYMQACLMDRRILNPMWLILMTILQIIFTILWAYISNRIYYKIYPPLNVIIVYENDDINEFIQKINMRNDKYNIKSIIHVNEGLETIISKIVGFEAVIIYDVDSLLRNKILKECYSKSIPVYMTPKLSDIIISSSDEIHLFDAPLFYSKNDGISLEQRIFKRFIDIVISCFLIFITSPVMVIIAIAIKVNDGGPILYKQKRLTYNNKVFYINKFRSMIVSAENDGVARLATKNDNRITNVGNFIRKVRFDELPQLFNIIKGDMSLVGPRPERPEIAEKYIELIPEFEFRTKVKAGLTGYAQIMGKYNTNAYDKLKLDLMYIEKFSLIMDFKIIFMTIKYLFTPKNIESTEGVNEVDILTEHKQLVENRE